MKSMYKYRLHIDGMMCGMCEAHVNDLVRKKLTVKKVKSSHRKKETVIVSEFPQRIEDIKNAFDGSGYIVEKIELI